MIAVIQISVKKKHLLILIAFVILLPTWCFSQVKIGNNPSVIDSHSILELESNSQVFVLTRLNTAEINALTPLPGALVYNTDIECIFSFTGLIWKNLCNEPNITTSVIAPVNNQIGDFWINSNNNIFSIWNGTNWLPININPSRGSGLPNNNVTNPIAGDIYVDQDTGSLYTYNGTDWASVNNNHNLNANNGIAITNNTVQLGGALIQPTIITTSNTNTLALQGLQNTTLDTANNILVVDNSTGEIKKAPATNLLQQQQTITIAIDGQRRFNPPDSITDINKLDVYRNGVRIAFALIDTNTIEIEPEATCYAGDEIRIVQLK